MPRCTRLPIALVIALVLAVCACAGGLRPGSHGAAPQAAPPPDLVAALYKEFARLGIDPDKVPAMAPHGEASRVFFLLPIYIDPDGPGPIPATVELIWVEEIAGDYNQDGEVGINDLTPLGAYWQETVTYDDPALHGTLATWPSGAPDDDGGVADADPAPAGTPAHNWRVARADGNNDGQITINDITPIGQHWRERSDGYRVYRASSLDPVFALLPNAAGLGLPYTYGRQATYDATRPVIFAHVGIWIPGETWERFYVAPYDETTDEEGPPSAVVEIHSDGSTHLAPVAALTATPPFGPSPIDVVWSASGSYDLDGNIVKYEWDVNNDGVFELDTGTTSTIDEMYATDGDRTVGVQVTDNEGLTDTATLTAFIGTGTPNQNPTASYSVDLNEDWVPFYVTFNPVASSDPDGTIALYQWDFDGDGSVDREDPTPITFQHQFASYGSYQVQLTVTDDQGGTDSMTRTVTAHGWETSTITTVTAPDVFLTAIMAGDSPAIAWMARPSFGNTELTYTRSANDTGTRWDAGLSSVWSAPRTDFGGACSMTLCGNQPAIAFVNGARAVRFIRANDAQGSTWPANPEAVHVGLAFDYIALNMVDGLPAVAWAAAGMDAGSVYYSRASDVAGTTWPARQDVSTGQPEGAYLNLLSFTGAGATFPIIAHGHTSTQQLMFESATDADGSSWAAQTGVTPADGCQGRLSMALIGGYPAIACYGTQDPPGPGLHYHRSTYDDTLGFDWSAEPVIVRVDGVTAGIDVSLARVNYLPAVACTLQGTDTNNRLWYIAASDTEGSAWEEPVRVEPAVETGNGYRAVLLDVNGRPGIAHFRQVGSDWEVRFSYAH